MNGVGFRIESVWAFVAVHEDDDEGIVGFHGPNGWLPAIAADQERLHQLKPHMKEVAKATKQEIKLVRFDQRTDMETYT